MMKAKYLVDTNTWIFFFKGKFGVRNQMLLHKSDELAVSEITIAELTYGAYHSDNFDKHIKEAYILRNSFEVIPISDCIDEYGRTRDYMARRGTTVENFDLLIAATAIRYNLTLVTENLAHFENIPHLKVVNWVDRNK